MQPLPLEHCQGEQCPGSSLSKKTTRDILQGSISSNQPLGGEIMKKTVLAAIALILAALAGYIAYDQITAWHMKGVNSALEQERERALQERNTLALEASSLKAELDQYKENLLPKDTLKDVFGSDAPLDATAGKALSCQELEDQIASFFTYLETKEYGKTCKLPGKPFDLFQQMLVQLAAHVPSVSDEMASLDSLMNNMTYFYRLLGRKRVACIRSILTNEAGIIEPLAASLYAWLSSGDCCSQKLHGCPSMEVLYEYAAYFLNTLAGRSYLMRRDATLRVLANYYCVLIIDRANDASLNRHGIDLRPHIDLAYHEISNQRGLINKKHYLENLELVGRKYRNGQDS